MKPSPLARPLLILFCVSVALALPAALAQSVLRAGDRIEIRLGGVPSEEVSVVSGQYTIDPEGYINLSHIGKVRAAGLQQHELQSAIESSYRGAEIYSNPTITVNSLSGDRFVNVDGEVRNRQRVPYTPDMTLMSAINAAGGVNEFADQKRVQLSREGKSEHIDIRRIRRDPSLDLRVQPGDYIYVPRSFW